MQNISVGCRRRRCRPDFDAAIENALARLAGGLSPRLYYHSLSHTRDDVLPAVAHLAALEGIAGEPLGLLHVAAAYHDIGFVERYADHEAASIRIARTTLPGFGFTAEQIRLVAGMIETTKVPQAPTNLLDAVLADGDLDSLGRTDFLATSLALRAELAEHGSVIDEADWLARQLTFLQQHHYWTASARRLRDPQKRRNIDAVKARLALM